MAGELMAVRTAFLEDVSDIIIKQLLLNLVDEEVFNPGEEEAILEEQKRADKARLLIDMVIKKGDEASWKTIAHLYKRNKLFAMELGLPAHRPQGGKTSFRSATSIGNSPDSGAEFKWSKTLVRCKKTFWNSKKNDLQIYPVTKESTQNRVALLINNIEFKDMPYRYGAEADARNMKELLSALEYEVVEHTNLTGKEIDKAIVEFSKHPKLQHTDSVIVVIMSHGKKDFIYGVDWTAIQIKDEEDVFAVENIYKKLASANCKALLNKPKIIIIQACRGKSDGSAIIQDNTHGVASDSGPSVARSAPADQVAGGLQYVHKEKDFLGILSCTPDTVSYRNMTDGAYFIQYIIDALNTFAFEDDIEEIIKKVMRRFEKESFALEMQMPTIERSTLPKRFYFFPGLFPTI
ncbi:caspase a-like [Stigmatopora nigra]